MGEVDRLTPERVDGGALTHQATGHRPAVDADPHRQRGAILVVEAVQDLGDFLGEGDDATGVVNPRHDQSAGRQQTVVLHAAHLIDAVSFGRAVEGPHQRVEGGDGLPGRQRAGEVVEPKQLGVDDRHIAVLGADVFLAVAVSTGLGLGHQGGQQFVVLPALFDNELLFGLQTGAHVVERRPQLAELVASGHRHADTEFAAADPAHRVGKRLDRSGQNAAEQQRQQAHDQHDRRGGQGKVAGETVDRGQHLRLADRRDDRPVQAGDVQRGVGHQRLRADVIARRVDAGLPRQRPVDRDGVHRLQQHTVAGLDLSPGNGFRRTVGSHVGDEAFRITQQVPGDRAHQLVRPGQVGLPGTAETVGLPPLVPGHHGIDFGRPQLQRQRPVDAVGVADRRHDPGCGHAVGGRVVLEVREDHLVDRAGLHRLPVCLGELCRLVRAVPEVGAQVDTLHGGVNDVAVGVEQHHVVETEPGNEVGEELLVAGVDLGPFAVVTGRGDFRGGDEIPLGGHHVGVLQIGLGVRRRSEQLRVDFLAGALGQRGPEHVRVIGGHGLLRARRQRGLL